MNAERASGRRVVVGYDGSDAARRALARAVELATPEGSVVVAVVERGPVTDGLGESLLEQAEPDRAERLLAEARELAEASGTAIETVALEGSPGPVLEQLAGERRADLLVVGRRGGDFVARALLGSVAAHLAQYAPCDVLIVR